MTTQFNEADLDFIESALNHYWHDANTNLDRKDIGDIERKNYESQLSRSKEIMTIISTPTDSTPIEGKKSADWLETKFTEILDFLDVDSDGSIRGRYESVDKCIKITEQYAQQTQQVGREIEFAEWIGGKYLKFHGGWMPIYADQRNTENLVTTQELYTLFLNSLNK